MVKTRSDKVLESLDSPEFPKESEMVIYIHKLLRVTIKYKKFNLISHVVILHCIFSI